MRPALKLNVQAASGQLNNVSSEPMLTLADAHSLAFSRSQMNIDYLIVTVIISKDDLLLDLSARATLCAICDNSLNSKLITQHYTVLKLARILCTRQVTGG